MNSKKIEEMLTNLRQELDEIEPLEGEQSQALESLKEELDRCLELSEQDSLHSLWERLRQSVETFEESHPKLTDAINEAINILVSSGV
jgi:uncharacterized protein YukE